MPPCALSETVSDTGQNFSIGECRAFVHSSHVSHCLHGLLSQLQPPPHPEVSKLDHFLLCTRTEEVPKDRVHHLIGRSQSPSVSVRTVPKVGYRVIKGNVGTICTEKNGLGFQLSPSTALWSDLCYTIAMSQFPYSQNSDSSLWFWSFWGVPRKMQTPGKTLGTHCPSRNVHYFFLTEIFWGWIILKKIGNVLWKSKSHDEKKL